MSCRVHPHSLDCQRQKSIYIYIVGMVNYCLKLAVSFYLKLVKLHLATRYQLCIMNILDILIKITKLRIFA